MKDKKIGQIIILCAFAIILCFSRFIWFFAEKYIGSPNNENREMAPRPELTLESYPNYSTDYTSYFNDNLQFRNSLITLNSAIDYFCFKKSSSSYVIIGDEDYLFYSRTDDGDPVSCYQGRNLYDEASLRAIADNCIAQRDFLAEQGKEFVIFIAPNKERVYSELMPDRYGEPAEDYAVKQIYEYLKANTDLRVVYAYDELMKAKSEIGTSLWYKTDTHWNSVGGYVGAKALLRELGIDMPEVSDDVISITAGDHKAGDLASMLNLTKQLEGRDYVYTVEGYDDHNSENLEWNDFGVISYHAENADPRKVYFIRDSFIWGMAPYIGSQFNDSYLQYNGQYSYDDLMAQNPDVVVYEVVERYAARLMDFSLQ